MPISLMRCRKKGANSESLCMIPLPFGLPNYVKGPNEPNRPSEKKIAKAIGAKDPVLLVLMVMCFCGINWGCGLSWG